MFINDNELNKYVMVYLHNEMPENFLKDNLDQYY